jgi:ATP-dependent DNA helicase PIF1
VPFVFFFIVRAVPTTLTRNITVSLSQTTAFEGKNVFITGVAGTGKSLVTQKIVNDAKDLRKEVAVVAPTGVAAVNLGTDLAAQTVHSLAGCGVPQSARDFAKILTHWSAKKWRKIEVLVLDEVGMLNADYLGMCIETREL